MTLHNLDQLDIAVIGLGYVGLPLAVEFGKKRSVVGFDINTTRIKDLKNGLDKTLEVEKEDLQESSLISFTSNISDIKECNLYIVTVPTPIDEHKQPDISLLLDASRNIGRVLKANDVVVYESTVYPGATEEDCVPVLEKESGLIFNKDFFVGYSPERINPGDKEHKLPDILKVTSGSTKEVASLVDDLYNQIITAGTYKAKSIKVAEAAKVIENTQRDINIALINELAIIFNKMNLETKDVLDAAGTKWNFLDFKPGLVGGHCIGVDPYYLTHKAKEVGYIPNIILAGRKLNDEMGTYVAEQMVKALEDEGIPLSQANILIAGFTFKENCPDFRNTKVLDIYNSLLDNGLKVDLYDPWVDMEEVNNRHGLELVKEPHAMFYDGIIAAVNHDVFKEKGSAWFKSLGKAKHIFYDLKNMFQKSESDLRL